MVENKINTFIFEILTSIFNGVFVFACFMCCGASIVAFNQFAIDGKNHIWQVLFIRVAFAGRTLAERRRTWKFTKSGRIRPSMMVRCSLRGDLALRARCHTRTQLFQMTSSARTNVVWFLQNFFKTNARSLTRSLAHRITHLLMKDFGLMMFHARLMTIMMLNSNRNSYPGARLASERAPSCVGREQRRR
jgi:hypothetical protein